MRTETERRQSTLMIGELLAGRRKLLEENRALRERNEEQRRKLAAADAAVHATLIWMEKAA